MNTAIADPRPRSKNWNDSVNMSLANTLVPKLPPVVRVRGWEINGERRYEVADNGIGIEAKYHKTIFLMFARLHNHDDYIGAGLGLAACAKVAANHGGEISVTSQLGRGSAFHITLNGQDMA